MALPSAPPRPVTSADELLALAHAMEREAAERYADLAARMRLRGDLRLGGLFEFLSKIELKHADHVGRLALDHTGHTPDPARIPWDVPENFDEEAARSRLLTPYDALAIAVRNEERAFAYYCYVAAEAPTNEIRTLAEDLAKEELSHAALLRRERRKAYREVLRTPLPAAQDLPRSAVDLFAIAAALEAEAAAYHRVLAEALEDKAEAEAFMHASEDEAAAARAAAERAGLAQAEAVPPSAPPTLENGIRLLEASFERYADIAERARNEAVTREAQALAGRAVRRLALVNGSLRDRLIARA